MLKVCTYQHVFDEAWFTGTVDTRGHVDACIRHVNNIIPLYHSLASSHDEATATAIEDKTVGDGVLIPITGYWRHKATERHAHKPNWPHCEKNLFACTERHCDDQDDILADFIKSNFSTWKHRDVAQTLTCVLQF